MNQAMLRRGFDMCHINDELIKENMSVSLSKGVMYCQSVSRSNDTINSCINSDSFIPISISSKPKTINSSISRGYDTYYDKMLENIEKIDNQFKVTKN